MCQLLSVRDSMEIFLCQLKLIAVSLLQAKIFFWKSNESTPACPSFIPNPQSQNVILTAVAYDFQGFTALTEKFSMNTSLDRGADELTQTLNHYVGDIVEGEFRTMYDRTLKNTHYKQSISKLSLFENRSLLTRKVRSKMCTENMGSRSTDVTSLL